MEEHQTYGADRYHEGEQKDDNRTEKREVLPYAIPFSILLAGVIIAGAIMFTNRGSNPPVKQLAGALAGDDVQPGDFKSLEVNAPMLGNPAAPVAVVEFADFQCPFCGRFYKTTAKSIIDNYVKTGKVKFIYHDFAFLGEESSGAAQAARCAGDQGKYWQYHDYLYEHQNGENDGAFANDHLKVFAQTLGLNADVFNKCLDSGKHKQDVENDTALGRKFGVTGTPTTFVNGKAITGAVPFSDFEQKIQAVLGGK